MVLGKNLVDPSFSIVSYIYFPLSKELKFKQMKKYAPSLSQPMNEKIQRKEFLTLNTVETS